LITREQQRPDVVRRRRNFAIAQRFVEPERFVFLNESSAKTNMTRLFGRAKVEMRCNFVNAHGHWKTTTMIRALRRDSVIEKATLLLDGPMDAATFCSWVERCLTLALRRGDVVVMDNLSAHKTAGVEEAIERVGASVWFLPPYSPDLNPIEKLWSKIKVWLRRVAGDTFDALAHAAGDAFGAVTPTECANYFQSFGYTKK